MSIRAPRPRALLLPLAAGTALLACGGPPSAGDFRSEAEDFIDGDLDGDAALNGLTFDGAACQEPASTDSGTAFTCTATGSDGGSYTFTVNITGRNGLQVVGVEPPLPAAPPGTTAGSVPGTAPAAGTPTTVPAGG